MAADKRTERSPKDLSVPETMKIAALLAELMPPGAVGSKAAPISLHAADAGDEAGAASLAGPSLQIEELDDLEPDLPGVPPPLPVVSHAIIPGLQTSPPITPRPHSLPRITTTVVPRSPVKPPAPPPPPVVEITPAAEVAPAVEVAPVIEAAPAVEAAHAVKVAAAAEGVAITETAPAAESAPAVEVAATIEIAPMIEAAPAPEIAPLADELPSTPVPPPLPKIEAADPGDEPVGEFMGRVNWQNQPDFKAPEKLEPPPAVEAQGPNRPLDPELIPLGNLSTRGFFDLVNWRNDPERVRHPRRSDYGLDEQTLSQARRNPFYVVGQPRRPESQSLSEILNEIAWE